MTPKVFISYSWSSQAHQALVLQWAEQLIADGIDVVMDIYDLKEGHDKFAFMERMVTDPSVSHVLIISDKVYSEKADARKAGVGTESQIISKEVYDKIEQSKFIPVLCEISDEGTPFLPTFLKSRIWIDFSSPEKVNENWETLIRLIFGKPLHEKPKLGSPPVYITNDTSAPSSPAITKFNAFRQALLQNKKGLAIYRKDFLSACIDYADKLRVRERPNVDFIGKKILEDCNKLKHIRDHVIDWVVLESEASPTDEFEQALLSFLEELREIKSRPAEVSSWNQSWFEAHTLFVYETFLYVVAALLKANAYKILHEIFTTHYLRPSTERWGNNDFDTFACFWGYSEVLQTELAPPGRTLLSPAAELVKRHADRKDLPFSAVIEADLLILLMSFLNPAARWLPQMLYYSSYSREFPFFIRAAQHKHFLKLAIITGVDNADKLRAAVQEGHTKCDAMLGVSFFNLMNMEKIDSIN